MKIGQQQIDRAESVAGRDENIRRAVERPDLARGVARRLEQAQRRAADRHDPPARGARGVDAVRRGVGDQPALRVHAVIAGVVHLDRKEGPGAHVQRQVDARDGGAV